MNIKVLRDVFSGKSTGSQISVDGVHQCFGLEPAVAEPPIKPRAIPEGTYRVTVRWSQKHKRNVPHVENVPDFQDIEIHIGNFPKDTEGCLLVGESRGEDFVGNSGVAFHDFFDKITKAIDAGESVDITYTKSQPQKTAE